MTDKKCTWIAAIVGIIAVIIVIILSPSPTYQARGILLPSQQTRPSISPDAVMQLRSRPFNGVVMGHINIERHYPAVGVKAQDDIAQLARKLAAQAGANAIVVSLFRIGQVTSSNFVYVFQATAYYVPMVNNKGEELLYQ